MPVELSNEELLLSAQQCIGVHGLRYVCHHIPRPNVWLIAGQQENGSEVASKPDQLPGPGDVERLLNRLQRKDPHQIFKEPVTDAVVSPHLLRYHSYRSWHRQSAYTVYFTPAVVVLVSPT